MNTINIRANLNRGRIVIALLLAMLLLQVILHTSVYFKSERVLENYSLVSANSFFKSVPISIMNMVIFLIYIVTIVFYISWFRRAYYNLASISSKLRYRNGWAVGSWFIPGFHWVGPFQIMLELYSKIRTFLKKNNTPVLGNWIFLVFGIWWILYVVSGVRSIYLIFQEPKNYHLLESFKDFMEGYFISVAIQFPLTLSAILVVLIHYIHERRLERISHVRLIKKKTDSSEILDDNNGLVKIIDIVKLDSRPSKNVHNVDVK